MEQLASDAEFRQPYRLFIHTIKTTEVRSDRSTEQTASRAPGLPIILFLQSSILLSVYVRRLYASHHESDLRDRCAAAPTR
jgi:hypothetical protein